MKLTMLMPGDMAVVEEVRAEGEIANRLLDMGLVKGAVLTMVRAAPLGDPIEIKLRGFLLSLRLIEAREVSVKKISNDAVFGGRHRHRYGKGRGRS